MKPPDWVLKKEFDYIIYPQVKVMILHILFSDWVLILNECRRHILNTNLTFQPGLLEEEPGPGFFLKPNSKSVVSILKIWQFWNWFQKKLKISKYETPGLTGSWSVNNSTTKAIIC